MQGFLSDPDVAARILDHISGESTDEGDVVWREPVANYVSPERYQRELDGVLRRLPVPFCPSAALPEPGSYVARSAAGVPLLAARDEEGVVRVFRNSCRHRGTEVAQGAGCSKSFVCPYHAWTYRLSGALSHVPHERGFPNLDRSEHGLVEVASREEQGIVFVNQHATDDFDWGQLPDMVGGGQRLLAITEAPVAANWKVALEGFIEGYHIRATHPESFYPYGYDNLNLVETVGRHSRVTYPFRRIESLADVAPERRKVLGLLTYVYHLFPNVLVTVLSHHTNLVVLEPTGIASTTFHVYTMTNRTDAGSDEDAKARRDAEFVNDSGGAEDRAIVESIQRSISTGANEAFTFGRFEKAIVHFHTQLRAVLAE